MTATYTPEVAEARKTLNEADFVGPHSAIARDAVRLLLADHARLAEENVKLRRVAKAAKAHKDARLNPDTSPLREALLAMGIHAALLALEVQNG